MIAATSTDLDERDALIFRERFHALYDIPGPRVGDYVEFADGVTRRISFVTPEEWLPDVDSVQTSALPGEDNPWNRGNFYLGDGYVNFSGGLYSGVKRETLTETGNHRRGPAWFFHHDDWRADNGVTVELDWRVFRCSEPAPR